MTRWLLTTFALLLIVFAVNVGVAGHAVETITPAPSFDHPIIAFDHPIIATSGQEAEALA